MGNFVLAFVMFLVVMYVIHGINAETNGKIENKNDERWKVVVAKADSTALNAFYILSIIMAGITIGSDILKRFEFIRTFLSQENMFELYKYYAGFLLCIVFAIRTAALKHYNKKI